MSIGKSAIFNFLLFMMSLQANFIDGPSDQVCTISNAHFLVGDEKSSDLCARFQNRLASVLGHAMVESLIISIDVSKGGTINADVSQRVKDEVVAVTTMSVDVMDRPLSVGDLDQLADAVANKLANHSREP